MKRKIVIFILSAVLSLPVRGENLPLIDYKPVHFGFMLGMNVLDYGIRNSMTVQPDGKIYQADVSVLMPGFSVGLVSDVRLNQYFNLRFVPTFYLGDRELVYVNNQNDDLYKTSIKSTSITVPLHVKYSSVRINNYRPYVLLGGGVLFEFSHDKSKAVLQRYTDYFIEFGVGCTFYTEYFRLAPELRFALGFRNLLTPWSERVADTSSYVDPALQPYSDALSRLTSRLFTIAINFE